MAYRLRSGSGRSPEQRKHWSELPPNERLSAVETALKSAA